MPFVFAFSGGMGVAARVLRVWAVPAALAAGIVVQLAYPGDFGSVLRGDSPSWPAWTAALGGCAALAAGLVVARRAPLERSAAFASEPATWSETDRCTHLFDQGTRAR